MASYDDVPAEEYRRLWIAALALVVEEYRRKIEGARTLASRKKEKKGRGERYIRLADNSKYYVRSVDLETRLAKNYFSGKDGQMLVEFAGVGLNPDDFVGFYDRVAKGEETSKRRDFVASRVT